MKAIGWAGKSLEQVSMRGEAYFFPVFRLKRNNTLFNYNCYNKTLCLKSYVRSGICHQQ